jgi:hypothetical protein
MLKKILLVSALAVLAFSQIGKSEERSEGYMKQLAAVEKGMCESETFMDLVMAGPFAEFTARIMYRTDLRSFLGEDMTEDAFVENMQKEVVAQRPEKAEPFTLCEIKSELVACENVYKDIADAGGPAGLTGGDSVTVDEVDEVFKILGITDCALLHGRAQIEGEENPMNGTFYLGMINDTLNIFYLITETQKESPEKSEE